MVAPSARGRCIVIGATPAVAVAASPAQRRGAPISIPGASWPHSVDFSSPRAFSWQPAAWPRPLRGWSTGCAGVWVGGRPLAGACRMASGIIATQAARRSAAHADTCRRAVGRDPIAFGGFGRSWCDGPQPSRPSAGAAHHAPRQAETWQPQTAGGCEHVRLARLLTARMRTRCVAQAAAT